jgi:hypothetical protein
VAKNDKIVSSNLIPRLRLGRQAPKKGKSKPKPRPPILVARSFVFNQVNITFLSKNLVLFTLARIQNYGLIMYEVLLTLGTTFLR